VPMVIDGSGMELSIEKIEDYSTTSEFDTLSISLYNGTEK